MGGMGRFMSLCLAVHAIGLLTVSFFVLVVLRKVEERGLKAFGYVVAALLWLAALTVFSAGVYKMTKSGKCMMPEMMKGKMHQGMMRQQGGMPPMAHDKQ